MTQNNFTHSMPNPDNITRVVLENGITVLVYENFSTRSVVMSGTGRGGAVYESPEYGGLASLTASTLMTGTQNRDFQALASVLEDIGADFGYGGGINSISLGGKALAEDFGVLVDVMADTLLYPTFPDEQVARRRGEALTWLQYSKQDTAREASRAFREALYPAGHPYHYAARGTVETLPRIEAAHLRQFHAKHYGPDGMILAVVGAVKAEDVIGLLREKLGGWRNDAQSEAVRIPDAAQPTETNRVLVPINGKTQSDFVLGIVGPSRHAEDYQAARMANSILGEFGMMGRIGDEVREKAGMAYYAYSRVEGGHGPGAWSVTAGVNPSNVDKAVQLSLNEVRRMMDTHVTAEELADNKSYFIGRVPLQLESNEGIAGTILSMESFDLGLDYLVRMPGIINSLTQDDLREAVRRYWNPDAAVIAVAGPQS